MKENETQDIIRRTDFARAYSKEYGVPLKYAKHDTEKFWELLTKLLYEENKNIVINGIGSFKQIITKARRVVHPGTKELIIIPAKRKIKFNMPYGVE